MAADTILESRKGSVTGTPEEVYNFVTDIRNFGSLIPDGYITDWEAAKDSGSFSVSPLGSVNFRLDESKPFTMVSYKGLALSTANFALDLIIEPGEAGMADVKVRLGTDLNPVLRMMADAPARRFLETLIAEMEKFTCWKDRE
ncbi:MAG: hypothetical protein RBU28_04100 [Bacteroidales bacterium]|jgi:carbon monoxide dehydrogenase subunit G|nr:hypothetical protein [Bacteroidales bacterium]